MKNITFLLLFVTAFLNAQIPAGYYDDAEGLTGENLRTALNGIIDNHHAETYDELWTDFKTTDKKTNGKVWDMYSTRADGTFAYEYTFVTDQCGSYSGESSCYNREHSFPKSWFNDASPMYTDLFHLYPTDGYVNGKRSNYPFGEVGTASWTSTNGSKLGSCSYPGYTGTVFEPIDEYKGDFARTYFYMVTRYKTVMSSWSSDMITSNNLTTWAINMLIDWSELDPVSQKEIDRNNAVYTYQNNRNPFIDHPEYICYIWSGCTSDISKIGSNVSVTIFPNPATDFINITYNSIDNNKITATIYNAIGEKITDIELIQNSNKINIQNLENGVYFIKIKTQTSEITKKFVVL